jgi:hypothetical protein
MNYKIIINIPGREHPTEVLVTEEQLALLEPRLNEKRIVKIGDNYYNTTYIAEIIKDTEANLLEKANYVAIEETTQTQAHKNNRQAINELKEKLLNNSILND